MIENVINKNEALNFLNILYPEEGHLFEFRGLNENGKFPVASIVTKDRASALDKINCNADCRKLTWYMTLHELDEIIYSLPQKEEILITKNGTSVSTTDDSGVARLRWLVIDCDPVRLTANGKRAKGKFSSSKTEKQAAANKAKEIKDYLLGCGFGNPLIVDSGNGYHLYYKIDLDTAESTGTIKPFLEALERKFPSDADNVDVDTTVFNAGRIMKLAGSMTHKGGNSPDRPWRMARKVHGADDNGEYQVISKDMLHAVINSIPMPEKEQAKEDQKRSKSSTTGNNSQQHNLEIARRVMGDRVKSECMEDGSYKLALNSCVFDSSHTDAAVYVNPNGVITYNCFHQTCNHEWKDVRMLLDDEYRQRQENPKDYQAPSHRPDSESELAESSEDAIAKYIQMAKTADQIERYVPTFCWYPYIPNREYTVCFAAGGSGKSFALCGILAALSAGKELPEDNRPRAPEKVMFISSEDKAGLIKARFEDSGGNSRNLIVYGKEESVGLEFEDGTLPGIIRHFRPKVCVIDPWHAFIGQKVDVNRINQLRPCLQKISALAEECDCGIILVSHVNKRAQGENANNAASGSADLINAARSGIIISRDESSEDQDEKILIHSKANYSKLGESLKYKIVNGGIQWCGTSEINREVLEQAARQHKTAGEVITGKKQKHDESDRLINALLKKTQDLAVGDSIKLSYDDLKEEFGADIFGSTQPKKMLDFVSRNSALEHLAIVPKIVRVGASTKNGIQITKSKDYWSMASDAEALDDAFPDDENPFDTEG